MPATATYSPTGDSYVDGVMSGVKWAATSLTFSFPASSDFYGSGYGSGEPSNNFQAFNSAQQTATRAALQYYSSVINVTFTKLTETSSQHGDLRFAESDAPSTVRTPSSSRLMESGTSGWSQTRLAVTLKLAD
jgi:serralysin